MARYDPRMTRQSGLRKGTYYTYDITIRATVSVTRGTGLYVAPNPAVMDHGKATPLLLNVPNDGEHERITRGTRLHQSCWADVRVQC